MIGLIEGHSTVAANSLARSEPKLSPLQPSMRVHRIAALNACTGKLALAGC